MQSKRASLFMEKVIERLERLDRQQIEQLLRGLRSEREFLQDVFDLLTEGILALDAEWQVIWYNKSALRLIGMTGRKRLIGEKIFNLPLDDAILGLLRRYALSPADFQDHEVVVSFPTEGLFSISLVSGQQDGVSGQSRVLILEDHTARRKEQSLRQETEKLASLATLTAGVAHEIKNPLNALKIHAQLLDRMTRNGPNEAIPLERFNRSIHVILEEIDRLGAVVDKFLTAARPTRPEFRTQRLNPVIERLVNLIRPEMEEKGIALEIELAGEPIELQMDEPQIMQALVNITRNAIEAIETRRKADPDAEAALHIRSRADSNHVYMMFSDTGCGIAQADMQRIKEPYYTTKFSGTGLGLMVVYRVVREHHGRLDIRSELDVGTTITLTLPRERGARRYLTHHSAE